jgi:hypothetical protein
VISVNDSQKRRGTGFHHAILCFDVGKRPTGERVRQETKEILAGKTPKRAYMTSSLNSGVCKLIGVWHISTYQVSGHVSAPEQILVLVLFATSTHPPCRYSP